MRRFSLVYALLTLTGACGGASHTFSKASISADRNKMMSDLTADERTSVCNEFSRALTASFSSKEVACKFGSLGGSQSTKPTCQSEYSECLNSTMAPGPISGCTAKMADMWSCPITIGQYQDCFNDFNSQLLDTVVGATACMPPAGQLQQPASCIAAPCDYIWFD